MATFKLNSDAPVTVKQYKRGDSVPVGLYYDSSGDLLLVGSEDGNLAVFYVTTNVGGDASHLDPVDANFISFPLCPAPAGTSLTITQD